MIECCGFGRVVRLICVDGLDSGQQGVGSAAVTFQDIDAARICVEKLHGKAFDGRIVQARLLTPGLLDSNNSSETVTATVTVDVNQDNDVDDFLNSLL